MLIANINKHTQSYGNYTMEQRLKAKAERLEDRVNSIADDTKREAAKEIKNRILHGDYSKEKMLELQDQFREIVGKHGDMNIAPGIGLVRMHVNVGTEDEPIWAHISGTDIFIKTNSGDEDGNNPNFTKLEDMKGLDKNAIARLLQYQQFINAVNGDEEDPFSFYLLDNLRDATSFFNSNDISENEDAFRSFVNWMFAIRANGEDELHIAKQTAQMFLEVFFNQLHDTGNIEQSFLGAWYSIQHSQYEGGYSATV